MPLLTLATTLLLAKNFAYAMLLGVGEFGVLAQCLLIGNAAALFCGMGMQWVAQKKWPQYAALRDSARVDASMAVALAVATLLTAGGFVIALTFLVGAPETDFVYLTLPVFSLAQYLFTIGVTSVRSELEFLRFARLSFVRAMLTALLGLAVAAATGDVATVLLTEALATAAVGAKAIGAARLRRVAVIAGNRTAIVAIARSEVPGAVRLLALAAISYALFNLDRWIGLATLSAPAYGAYAAGAMILVAFETLQAMVNVAVQPMMARRLATGDLRRVLRFAHMSTAVAIGAGLLISWPLITTLRWFVLRLLPGFEDSVAVIAILVPAGFLRLADFYGTLAILRDREVQLALGAVFICIVALVGTALARWYGIAFTPARLGGLALVLSVLAFALRAGIASVPERRRAIA